ncbi:MAG: arylesterase [Acetobacteraceae bacterium]|nr:arylesterase [Acetobacteraceae bacterium]
MDWAYGRRAALQKTALGIGALLVPGVARAQAPQPFRLLALGDSLTAGYGLPRGQGFVPQLEAALRGRGRHVRVLDGGVSGDTMAGGAARLDWALAERPGAAIVALGGNDGLRGLPTDRMAQALESILSRLERRGIPTLLAGMQAPPNLGAEYGRAFQAVFTEAAARRPDLIFMPFFLEGVAGDRALNQPDGIHPNPQGVAEMIRQILPFTERLLDRAGATPAG